MPLVQGRHESSSFMRTYAMAQNLSRLALKRRRALRRPAMAGRLLIGVGQLQHVAVVVRPSHKGNPGRKVVARKSRRDSDRGNKYQERVQPRDSLLVDVRRIDSLADEGGLVLYTLVHDGVQFVIRHDF